MQLRGARLTGRPVIGLDLDGVMADFTHPFSVVAHDLFPHVPVRTSGAQLTWAFEGLTAEQLAEVWAAVDGTGGAFWFDLCPLFTRGERNTLVDLSATYDIAYVTARMRRAHEATSGWLHKHGLMVYRSEFHMPGGNKAAFLRKRYGDRLIGFLDDKPAGVLEMHAAGLPVWVRDWPYNRDASVRGVVPRVGSVGEFLAAVTR